jgi:transcriptional regulator with XRE-family HTH domain
VSAPQATYVHLGRAVRRMRQARDMTMEELADAAGMHLTYLSDIELYGRNLTWDKIAGLARGLGTTISALAASAEDERRRDHDGEAVQS